MMNAPPSSPAEPAARLGLWDAVSIIVGIVVGTSIFKTPGLIAQQVGGIWQMVVVWTLGGVLSLLGALCYAELASTYPKSGGDYVYLTRAFGRWVGFLFGWGQLTVIMTGSIGIMAFAFADYAVPLLNIDAGYIPALAVAAVVALTALNMAGALAGKRMQNLLTLCKVLGLSGILWAGMTTSGASEMQQVAGANFPGFGFAMILVLYAYGGWNDAAFVAAEVRQPQRNLPRALVLGIGGITLLYALINLAYAFGLGFEKLQGSFTPAADLLKQALGERGGRVMSALVVISALGAINGLIFTGSRVNASLGRDHRALSWLGGWHHGIGAPLWSLLAQMLIAVALILAVGTESGRGAIDSLLMQAQGLAGMAASDQHGMPWEQYFGGFDTLVAGTAPAFWLFFLLTGLSLFKLREIDPETPRPFRVPWYPFTPFIFCVTSLYMLYSSINYAGYLTLLGIVPLALGLPLYWISEAASRSADTAR